MRAPPAVATRNASDAVKQGMDPLVSTPEQFAALLTADYASYAQVIKTANIKFEP